MLILSITSLSVWLISTGIAWWQVKKEMNDVFDAQQVLLAEHLANSDLEELLLKQDLNSPRGGFKPHKRQFDDDALAFAIFTKNGDRLFSDGDNGARFIFEAKTGFRKSYIQGDDDPWRIFWLPVGKGELFVAVGQELEYREELVNDMIFGQMWIWFTSLPVLLLVLAWFIRKELAPIKRLSQDVQRRKPGDVSLLNKAQIPTEILPLVKNLNQFFDRTSTMLERERRFTSDAAHELRSPLAALRIQTEIAQLADDDKTLRDQALSHLTQGIDRASQLIEQLLTLSRLDHLQQLDEQQSIDWTAIIPSLIVELYFSAQKRDIELQFEQQGTPKAQLGQPILVSQMVRNLIDNAIKYGKQGSQVNVILQERQLIVEDNGGGVPEADLAQLGQRFYRPAGQNKKGSGLGLSIVFRIAELHHYKVRLENVMDLEKVVGLRVIIQF